ncbi:MAG: HD domain-containing protein [Halobacteriaceae archaeon]
MTTVKDSIHDHITISGVGEELLETPAVQRLRRVKQLGTVSYVYPSANHTRFEHSLGVYHIVSQALEHLQVNTQQAKKIRAAAILHDIGHGPFSHNLEDVIHRRTGKYHDDVEDLLSRREISNCLNNYGINTNDILKLIKGHGKYGQLIAGELDVDRMDYLLRDAHHTGVPYGLIDHGRLVRELTFIDDKLVLDEGNVQAAESLLLARALMNPTVYNHHVARISKTMLRRATEQLLDTTQISGKQLRRMDDIELFHRIRTHDTTAKLGERLNDRNLFKRAVWAEMSDVPADLLNADHEQIKEFEQDVAAKADITDRDVIIDIQPQPEMRESTSRVLVNGEVRRLDQQSTLVNALQDAQREQWRFGVYTPQEYIDRVRDATESRLGLETDGQFVSEITTPRGERSLDEFN